ncbi:MAG TPA: A/G-specific adenine glycosylase [Terriglobales bacterium]|nr:A/G-specific adenine glycosylase [Terriglobales bacterium]
MRLPGGVVAPADNIRNVRSGGCLLQSTNSVGFTKMDAANTRRFRRALLKWYGAHKRELPWRKDKDPYRVWVSEVMLQQTRVAAVIAYYERFMTRFPDVIALARARESSVLAAWSGLGYYRRAKALHAAAKVVAFERGGKFPPNSSELQQLPGIGRYTAAAIASIAFDEPCAVVDGNVERVLARKTGEAQTRSQAWILANALLERERPGDFNQAVMELGATVCTPKQPECSGCPVSAWCCTKGSGGSGTQRARNRATMAFVLSRREGKVFLVKRSAAASLMPGMWELPTAGENAGERECMLLKHSITSTDYIVRVLDGEADSVANGKWVPVGQLERLALTGLARKILKRAGII